MNLDDAANLIYIALPSLYHRFVEFFFMLSHLSLSLLRLSFITSWYGSICQKNGMPPIKRPSRWHLAVIWRVLWMQDCVSAQVVRDLRLTAQRFTLSVMDRAVNISDLDWWLLSFGGNAGVCGVHQHRHELSHFALVFHSPLIYFTAESGRPWFFVEAHSQKTVSSKMKCHFLHPIFRVIIKKLFVGWFCWRVKLYDTL